MRIGIFHTLLLASLASVICAQETTPQSTPTSTTPEDDGPTETSTTANQPDPTSTSPLGPPDVHLKVPELSVGRIELDVDNLRADINLNADIARLVQINAGVQVGIDKVNITIADVEAELELVVRLGNLVQIVNRTLASLDLNQPP
jgi:ABC-type transport system substrate-binding protein